MVNIIITILCSKCFWINWLIGIILVEYALLKTKVLQRVNEERDGKYPGLRRNDIHLWRRWRLYIGSIMIGPKATIGILSLITCYFFSRITVIGNDVTKPLPKIKRKLIDFYFKILVRILIFTANLFWVKSKKIPYNYSKYLGKDYVHQFDNASTIIGNHSVWIDILIAEYLKSISPVAKSGIKNWPLVGDLAYSKSVHFLDRVTSKEDKEKAVLKIGQRQRDVNAGLYSKLMLYPEGCTTNNTELFQFKRGAFYALESIQPLCIKYYSPYFQTSHDIMSVLSHIILSFCQPYTYADIKELPVFQPNDYFKNIYCKEFNEDRKKQGLEEDEIYIIYMKTIRAIMAETLNFKLSDAKLEDKFEYKELLYPSKGNKNKSE